MDTFIIITIIWVVICIIGCIIGLFGIAYNLGKIKGFEEFKELYEEKVREYNKNEIKGVNYEELAKCREERCNWYQEMLTEQSNYIKELENKLKGVNKK